MATLDFNITTSITDQVEAAYYSYRQQINNYILDCLRELGFNGDPHNIDEVERYLKWKNIEITIEDWHCIGPNLMYLITVECKREKYFNHKIFKFTFEVK